MATINVTSTADSGAGTLRQAITDLNAQTGSHTITFTGLTGTITLASVLPTLSRSMTITGPGLSNLTISGNNLYRVFVLGSATLTFNISGLTIANGRAASAYPGYIGGGIYNPSSGSSSTLNVDSCYFTGCYAGFGGSGIGSAIYTQGNLTVTNTSFVNNTGITTAVAVVASTGGTATIGNCTFSGNTGTPYYNSANSSCTVYNCTFSGNTGGSGSGGISFSTSASVSLLSSTISGNTGTNGSGLYVGEYVSLTLKNSIISGNTGSNDFYSYQNNRTVASAATNIIGTISTASASSAARVIGDPLLGALQNNGGTTQTMAVGAGSPAINAGTAAATNAAPVSGVDQRGTARSATTPTIGAVEYGGSSPSPPTVSSISPSTGTALGGTSVTITGTNLTGATEVTIGGVAATSVTVVNSTTITAITPAGTVGTASVLVTTSIGTNSANTLFTYFIPPNAIRIKRSSTTTSVPTSLLEGELAANIIDRKLWIGNSSKTPVLISDYNNAGGGSGTYLPLAGGAMTGSITSVGTTHDTEVAGDFFGVQLSADNTQGTMLNFDGLDTYNGASHMKVTPTGLTFPDSTSQTTAYTGGAGVSSVTAGTGISVDKTTGDLTVSSTITQYANSDARASISSTATGLTYTSATGVFSLTASYEIPTTTSTTNWNSAYTQRLQWDGGATNLVAATGRTSLNLNNVENTALSTWAGSTNITTVGSATTRNLTIAPLSQSNTTASKCLTVTAPAHTNLTAGSECIDVHINLARTVKFNSGYLPSQTAIKISAPTYDINTFNIADTASTVQIDSAPIMSANTFPGYSTALNILTGVPNGTAIAIKSATSQSADIFRITNSTNMKPFSILNTGAVVLGTTGTQGAAGTTNELRFLEVGTLANGSMYYVGFKAPDTINSNVIWTLPAADGKAGQALTTNASGVLSWSSVGSGTVTSVAALTLGTTGTDVSSTVATGTTTPVITLNIPTASATNRGALSSADWSNFNAAYTNRITSLTVTGSSGSATLTSNTLNIPTYTLSGLGGQASSTNLTSLSGLTYVSASFVKMTAAGTFALDTTAYTANTGTVTSIATTSPITGGTITGTGTIGINATSANTASYVVQRDASGNFAAGTITAALTGNASTATSLAGGGAGQVPYNTASGATSFLAAGTAGQVLQSNGSSAPSWASVATGMPTGAIIPFAAISPPTGYLLCDGSAISRSTYATLFSTITPSRGSITVTIASPAVVTLSAHGFQTGDIVYLTTTGALPTGLAANTLYYVINVTSSTFRLATSAANATASTAINTSGIQSGTHTLFHCPYGLGDGSTTFNVPDLRSRVPINVGQGSGLTNRTLGGTVGAETVALSTAELASHNHTASDSGHSHTASSGNQLQNHQHSLDRAVWTNNGSNPYTYTGGGSNIALQTPNTGNEFQVHQHSITVNTGYASVSIGNSGSGSAHNNMQPSIGLNYIIKT